ncbi:NosD domain-containing protein [Methanococcus sp. CF]
MKHLNFKTVLLSLIVFLAVISSISAEDTAINSTPYIITTNGTYVLTCGINCSSGSAITINCDNVTLDGHGYSIIGSHIYNSNGIYANGVSNITIKNVNVTNFYRGIHLMNVTGCKIENNSANLNMYQGICLDSSSNNDVINNTVDSNSERGIYLLSSSNTSVTGNAVNLNEYGITLYHSRNNSVTGNAVNSNHGTGMMIADSSSNFIMGNAVNSNRRNGISLQGNSDYNEITNNEITNNNLDLSFWSGIRISSSVNNKIYNNLFNNTNNYYSTSQNYWNTSKELGGGNYWLTPNGTGWSETQNDTDGDGFCDEPYIITSSEIDFLPLLWDKTAPEVSINTPLNGGLYNTSSDLINVTANDSRSYISVIAEINGTTNITLENVSGYFVNSTFNFSEGLNTIKIYANDSTGNVNSNETVNFTVDTINPKVEINTEPGYYNRTSNILNVSVTDITNVTVKAEINGTTNITLENVSGYFVNSTFNFSEGLNTIKIYANDSTGNVNSNETVNFTVDTINPKVEINTPTNETTYTTDSVSINVTANDSLSGISSVIAEIEGVKNVTLMLNGEFYTGTTGSLSNGNYVITVVANDNAGNVNSNETVNFTVAVPSSSLPSRNSGKHYSSDLADGINSSVIKSIVSDSEVVYGSEIDEEYAGELRENIYNASGYTISGDTIIVGGPLSNALAEKYDSEFRISISNDYPGENKGVIQVKNIQVQVGNFIKTYQLIYIAGSDRFGTQAALEYFKTLDELPEEPITVKWTENGPVLI